MAKILLIEDSAFERKAIINMLKKSGYTENLEAEDGEKGLEMYKAEKPNLVLLDLRLPGMDGLEVFKELKKINSGVKVIVVTIVTRQESVDEATKLGAKAYIMKPVTEKKLIPEVKRVVGGGSVATAPVKPVVKKPVAKPVVKKPVAKPVAKV